MGTSAMDLGLRYRRRWSGNDSSLLYDPTITYWPIITDYFAYTCLCCPFHRVGEWLLTFNSHVLWGFSFVQACPLGFQRPTRGFHEGFNGSLVKRFSQLIIMALDHSHQHNMQCQKEDRGEQCLYGQNIEINTTDHEQFHPSINKASTSTQQQPNSLMLVIRWHHQCWDLAMDGLSLLRSPKICILD